MYEVRRIRESEFESMTHLVITEIHSFSDDCLNLCFGHNRVLRTDYLYLLAMVC